ncbi:hypothetical protein [Shimia abyssi]|uniref:AAA+ family ATPase n=1 Tax=Shimia abyssi TaxID=1662395 RepID=A0A2P8FK03_9RHOB|nr:hypothetical protein [Shimia abyssi]PSL22053.1 hypothetical protein CLV88_101478 [Shimia abyssi]
MRVTFFATCAALMLPPSGQAEDADGVDLMEEGARLFLEGLQQQMAPALEGLQEFAGKVGPQMQTFLSEMGPALSELMDEVEDWNAYHPPEMLPNGDIIFRRKLSEEHDPPIEGETDL